MILIEGVKPELGSLPSRLPSERKAKEYLQGISAKSGLVKAPLASTVKSGRGDKWRNERSPNYQRRIQRAKEEIAMGNDSLYADTEHIIPSSYNGGTRKHYRAEDISSDKFYNNE